jgi:hypothetical protein
MAWTTPKTWADGDIVTGALLNTHIRDNHDAVSTHGHSGAAGDGNDELSGIDSIAFDDQSASPNAAGELQRNGANLEWYGSSVVAITQGDAAAGVASPRTIGTGALTAAPGNHAAIHNAGGSNALAIDAAAGTGSLRTIGVGATAGAAGNHTHTVSEIGYSWATNSQGSQLSLTVRYREGLTTSYSQQNTITHTPGATQRAIVVVGHVAWSSGSTLGVNYTMDGQITKAGVQVATVQVYLGDGDTTAASVRGNLIEYFDANPTVAAHTYAIKIKGSRTEMRTYGGSIIAFEVGA